MNYFDNNDNSNSIDLIFNFSKSKTAKRKKSLMDELDFVDSDDFQTPSQLIKSEPKEDKVKKKKKKKSNELVIFEDDEDLVYDSYNEVDDNWDNVIKGIKNAKGKKNFKNGGIFDTNKKKKKKKKEGSMVNHKKDFEPELILLKNLQMDHAKFVNSLQKKYDQMEATKSTSRGINKFTTDFIQSLTSARSVQMQLIDKVISTKKTIADLDFKERKEFGSNNNSEQVNLNNYASTYLRNMIDAGRTNITNSGYIDMPEDIDEDNIENIFDSIDESLGDEERSEDVEKYLKYENDNVNVVVYWYDDIESDDIRDKYEYIAINGDGEEVTDYPLPFKGKININRSTGFATDEYGNKYKLYIR